MDIFYCVKLQAQTPPSIPPPSDHPLKMLTDVLTEDLWSILVSFVSIHDMGSIACTCRNWRRVVSLCFIDRAFAQAYAVSVLGDPAFWRNASLRPVATRRSLPSYRLEIKRIEEFKRTGGRQRLAACELYEIWPLIDGK